MKALLMKSGLKKSLFLSTTLALFLSSFANASIHLSDLPVSEGHLQSERNVKQKGIRITSDSNPNQEGGAGGLGKLGGYDELVPFVLASPDQEDAGSCLYMAITGIAEWWLARLNPEVSRAPNGPIDLSERYIMNVAGVEEEDTHLKNWRTDSIYLFNQYGNKSLKNSIYRFTKGWYLGESYSDKLIAVSEGTPNAEYGTLYNWIDQRPQSLSEAVKLPQFEREVIFADPEQNQWNVGVAPDDIVERVKEVLRTRKAPVLVVYNQNSYWHAVFLVGYNDEIDNGNCNYTENFRKTIVVRAEELEKKASEATDPTVKKAYEIRAKRAREAKDKIERAYASKGGCSSTRGVFYIRDSIYPDEGGPQYDYDLSRKGDEAPYAKKIVFKEYDWLKYFSNHISVVYTK